MSELEDSLERRGVGLAVRERILRLNPNPIDGERLRGWYFKGDLQFRLTRDVTRKGDVLRQFGREVWERIPLAERIKRGRREFASRLALERARA